MGVAGAHAADVLVINGNGSASVASPLTGAGFNVIQGAFGPGVIANNLAANPGISQIWIWNDGTYGNTFSPVNPALSFSAADLTALQTFNATRNNWIMDGLSWRTHSSQDEQNLTKNEALNLASVGGGIVLGADDASGAAIVQHVNQVAGLFNFNLWDGVYSTSPLSQHTGRTFFTSPNLVNPSGVVGTTTYSEVPNGLQPNGLFLGTAVFGEGVPLQGYTPNVVPDLASQEIDGTVYSRVNHLITTTIRGATIDIIPPTNVPDSGSSLALLGLAAAGLAGVRRFRR